MMALLSSSRSLHMALSATVYFTVVLTTCSTQECTLPIVEELRNRSAFLTKADIKLIQIKCMEESCLQSNKESKTIDKTYGPIVHQENQPKVQTDSCGSVICNQTSKCVENGHEKICVEASTPDASKNVTPFKTVPLAPVTTKDPAAHATATPSPATVCDVYNTSRDGDLESVKRILIANHVDINIRRGQYNRTPVMAAAQWGHRGVVELLVGRGANMSLVDKNGNNVLHLACIGGELETVKLILPLNVLAINSRGQYSRTPVMAAARWGHRGVVELLVGRGANVSLVDKDGNNILLLACIGGELKTVKLIMFLNVLAINSRGQYSRTPVMVAARWGHRGVVELLVGRGADVSLLDKDGNSVIHWACIGGDLETVKLILSLNKLDINGRGAWTPVMLAARRGHSKVVKLLLGRGADMSLVDKYGYNILHLACMSGDVETVKLILSLNLLDINSRGRLYGKTPLMLAVQHRNRDVAAFLLERGSDVLVVGSNGNNVLHCACFGGDLETIRLILSLNVLDINARNKKGQTAADWMRAHGRPQVLDILMSRGDH